MARSAVRPGVFTGKQGQQGVNKLVIFAAVVGAVVVAGLPFISKEVWPAVCLDSAVCACAQPHHTKTGCWLGYAGAAPRAERAHDARRRDRRKGRGAQRAAEHQVTGTQEAALRAVARFCCVLQSLTRRFTAAGSGVCAAARHACARPRAASLG